MRSLLTFGNSFIPILSVRIAGLVLSFSVAVITANLLKPEGYGVLSYGLSLLGILSVILAFGLDQFSVKLVAASVAREGGRCSAARQRRPRGVLNQSFVARDSSATRRTL